MNQKKTAKEGKMSRENFTGSGAVVKKRGFVYNISRNKTAYLLMLPAMGCFNICDKVDFAVRMNSFFNKDVRLKLKSSEYSEAYRQILLSEDLKYDGEFFENKPFVNCMNGVVDVMTGELLPHEPGYHFKHCINAKYTPGASCPKYLKYIHHLFDGDKELIELLQVVQGYICSHYNNA